MNLKSLTVVSISFYGADMARGGKYSGALDRQRDYAQILGSLMVFVPGASDTTAVQEEHLEVRALRARGALAFAYRAYREVTTLAKTTKIDVIMVDNPHIAGLLGVVLRYRIKKPLIVHSMGDMLGNQWYMRERFSNRVKELAMRVVFRLADAYRVSTAHEISRLTVRGYYTAKVVSVPFYIDQARFTRSLEEVQETRMPKRALFVGRIGYQKDVATLVRAFAEVHAKDPEARLVIVGDGPLRASCESLARSLNARDAIEFTGAIPYEQVAREFARASLFVLPSLYEGTCMVLHEAAAARLPIVSTENAGALDFIGSTNAGWLEPVGDVPRLARAISDALQDQAGSASRGEVAFARLDAFTREHALTAFTHLIERALSRGARV